MALAGLVSGCGLPRDSRASPFPNGRETYVRSGSKDTENGDRHRRLARHWSRYCERLSGARLQRGGQFAKHYKSGAFAASDKLVLVDGNIAEAATAAKIAEAAVSRFGSIDALVNNAGIFIAKHFTDYTLDDLRSLVSVNIEGFFFITQLAIKQMLVQKSGGSIVNITTTMVDHPIAGINCCGCDDHERRP